MKKLGSMLQLTTAVCALSALVATAQNVPGTLSGVGTDASRAGTGALGQPAAPQDKAATPELAPPSVAEAAGAAAAADVGAVIITGDAGFAEARNLRPASRKASRRARPSTRPSARPARNSSTRASTSCA